MSDSNFDIGDIHWLMDILQNIDVGLVVLDRNYEIHLWNGFMESHSGISPQNAKGQNLFELFDEIPREWFTQKSEAVFQLKTRTFTIWEQRPYLFKFKNYRPITGRAATMYQNTSIIPLESINKTVDHICIIIYDVTDVAVNREDALKAAQSLGQLSRADHLTELPNRVVWEQEVQREYSRCCRSQNPSTLVVFDIDNLKQINAAYGHKTGDEVLKIVSDSLRQTMRQTDMPCRFGGDMFAILLVDTSEVNASRFAERIRKAIELLDIRTEEQQLRVTASIGVAEFSNTFASETDWIHATNKALLHGKQLGGDQVTLYHSKALQ